MVVNLRPVSKAAKHEEHGHLVTNGANRCHFFVSSVRWFGVLALRSLCSFVANPFLRISSFALICSFQAVAENQPGNKNRMSSINAFSGFTTRLRALIDCKEGEFNELAQELFALQFVHNPPYRRFCEARGIRPDNANSWVQVPPLPTSA